MIQEFILAKAASASSFQLIELIDIGRAVVPIHRDNEREANRRFSRRDGDRKNRHDHASWMMRLAPESPERDEIQVRCREHHLDPDQNENGVSPTQRGEEADREQSGRDNEE